MNQSGKFFKTNLPSSLGEDAITTNVYRRTDRLTDGWNGRTLKKALPVHFCWTTTRRANLMLNNYASFIVIPFVQICTEKMALCVLIRLEYHKVAIETISFFLAHLSRRLIGELIV